jgi:hypothetical protein
MNSGDNRPLTLHRVDRVAAKAAKFQYSAISHSKMFPDVATPLFW